MSVRGGEAWADVGERWGFDLEFVDECGASARMPLQQCWGRRFEDALPVRSFPSFKGQKNFTGLWWSATTSRHVGFESWVERDQAMLLDFDSNVVGFSSQPFRIWWQGESNIHRHVPDYFARMADGGGLVVDVRPDNRIEPEDAEAFAATSRLCERVGWAFRRVGELDPVLRANVDWLAGYRHPRCLRPEVAERVLKVFSEPTALGEGVRAAGPRLAVLPTLFHLMWSRRIVTDLHTRLLSSSSPLSVAGGSSR
ncbi:TnsA-like heteromeric transposase endonuclease subunit [Actinomadura madurae]|uniref:TnsA-like heteromeric transposase endonuclease subunit n=1 Tax=Actinomadura madurae TaxID=1993 RepID=UPI000942629A|nr:TnsA-like heteromeric transposase endonuclease subunit [Actinomadura madurae]